MKVCIAGEGYGGHFSAGMGIAQALHGRGVECIWIGSEAPSGPPPPAPTRRIELTGRGLGRSVTLGPMRALQILARENPDAVISTGGRTGGVFGLAAALARIPLFAQEQNAILGRANRMLLPFAREVWAAFPGTLCPSWGTGELVVTGTPVWMARKSAPQVDYDVVIWGGSNGSGPINEAALELLTAVDPRSIDFPYPTTRIPRILWVTGRMDARRNLKAIRPRWPARIRTSLTREEVRTALSGATLVIGRAGGSSIAEALLYGTPMALSPWSGAADDHQELNLQALEKKGAALRLPGHRITGAHLKETMIRGLEEAGRLREGIRAMTDGENPATIITDRVMAVIRPTAPREMRALA